MGLWPIADKKIQFTQRDLRRGKFHLSGGWVVVRGLGRGKSRRRILLKSSKNTLKYVACKKASARGGIA